MSSLQASQGYASPLQAKSLWWILLVLILAVSVGDWELVAAEPGHSLLRIAQGLVMPQWPPLSEALAALISTAAFALQGVALAVLLGFVMACGFGSAAIRRLAAFLRSIHELFWALLFIQVMGLTPLAGVLALAIPYAGTFAKIYGELFEEVDPAPLRALPATSRLSLLAYTTLPAAWPAMKAYTAYRMECGLRSAALLGFVGLPTLGVHLEAALRQTAYAEAAAWFYLLLICLLALRWGLNRWTLIPALGFALWSLPPVAHIDAALLWQFVSVDLVPLPLRSDLVSWRDWFQPLLFLQIGPGLMHTLALATLAIVATGVLALIAFPLASKQISGRWLSGLGQAGLLLLRSAPEYFLAFVGLLLFGPNYLPAILALSLHNGAIVAFVVGQYANDLKWRADAAGGLNRYFYECLPRLFRPFMAFMLYRFEIIMRETAVLGMLGIPTLGFFIDSAFSEFRFDRALVLLLVTALLNMAVDSMARRWRLRLHLRAQAEAI